MVWFFDNKPYLRTSLRVPRRIVFYVAKFYKVFDVLMVGSDRPDAGKPHQFWPADLKGVFWCIAVAIVEQCHQQADVGGIKSAFHCHPFKITT